MTCPHCHAPNADDARFCGTCGRVLATTEMSDPHMSAAGVTAEAELIGREIAGRYRMQAKLGEGGMGAVYKAEQISLKRTVAVKLLRPEVAGSQMLLRRFNAEAEAVAKLSHPNTVNIYDFGQDSDGTLFIAMEYIEGQSLRTVIQRDAPLPLPRALAIATQIAASLTDAHAHAIVHRDLKPDNVMLQERGRQRDVVRVLDFGIAKLRDENRQSQMAMTQAGDMLGTPQYMAPEQIRAETIDGRTDVYALGCMLYEMVTGRLPFEGPTVMSLLSKHLLEVPLPPSQRRPDLQIPPAIDQLVLVAMAKDAKARPATMELFGEQLAAVLAMFPAQTGQATAQATAQQGIVIATGAQPVAMPSSFAPMTPPPGPSTPLPNPGMTPPTFAPSVPPPGAPPIVPPGAPPGAPPIAPQLPPYDPYAHARAHPPAQEPAASGGGNKVLWALVALLLLGGIGTGVYFGVVRGSGGSAPPATPGSGSAIAEGPGSDSPVTPPDAAATAEPPDAEVATLPPDADPWNKGGGTVEPGGDDDDSTTTGIPEECEAYARTIEKLGSCKALPKQTRDAMAQAASQLRSGYANVALPPEVRAQVVAGCVQGEAQIRSTLSAYKCD